ncbi:MAG: dihydroorotase [Pseudomonadota bacterium]|nr:dihydroorotase [Pseudomonadota bacterium]
MTTRVTMTRPDDWHVHLRDGAMLRTVLPYTARRFGRAIVMPNLRPPVTTTARAKAYRDEILAALPTDADFTPLMTLYLTEGTDADDLARGHAEGIVTAVKLYPAHATTNSEFGITDFRKIHGVLERMQRLGVPLLVHGEATDPDIDVFDRESVFIEETLEPLRKDFPELKIVFEHITTKEAADYVMLEGAGGKLAATITAHHLLINRNALFAGGLRPHYYCLPVAKREEHRQALTKAATSGGSMFFLGTDTAPHEHKVKESACGCAGIFSAPHALEHYAQAFDQAGCLQQLEGFASLAGPAFYGLPVNKRMIYLEKLSMPEADIKPILTGDGGKIVPFVSPSPLLWRVMEDI